MHQLKHFQNPLYLFHVSTWIRAHRKHLESGSLFKKNLEGDWIKVTKPLTNQGFVSLSVEAVGNSSGIPIGAKGRHLTHITAP